MHLILASASPRRRDILRQVGIEPVIIPADIDENITETDPAEKVKKLSKLKAEAVEAALQKNPERLTIGVKTSGISNARTACQFAILAADTVVAIDGDILGKPASHDEAFTMISRLQGHAHSVFTGVTLLLPDNANTVGTPSRAETAKSLRGTGYRADTFAVETRVHVRPMTEAEIRAYADSEEPMDKAGAYGIQGAFAAYISGIEGDYYNVVGLPISEVMRRMQTFTPC